MQYHSAYQNGLISHEYTKDENLSLLISKFFEVLDRKLTKNDNLIIIYRAVMLSDPSEIKEPLGIYWAHSKDITDTYDGQLPTP